MNKSTILVVDDTVSNLDILVDLLDEFNVIEATNGEDALEILETQKVDLILLDIVMPNLDGFEVCSRLKQNPSTKNIPVIFITASEDETSIEKAYDVGGYDYVKKPFNPKELLARVKTQLKLQKLKYKEQEYSKQIALSELLQNIAHHWRQPLSSISTIASSVSMQKEMEAISDQEIISSCENIVSITSNLSSTIENFQNLLRKDIEKSIFTIQELIHRNYDMLFSCDISDLKVVLNIDESITLNTCQNKLIQVLLSLLNNSKDAFKESKPELKAIFLNVSKKDNDKVLIELYDTANGIDENIINRVFEPYFTTKNKSQGKGLGLYMVQNMVTQSLNGTISAYNYDFEYKGQELTGAKFDIVLGL